MLKDENIVDRFIRVNPQNGFFEPKWMHRDIMPYMLYPDAQFQSGAMVINAAGTPTPPFVYKNQHASIGLGHYGNPILINRITFEDSTDLTANANWTVMLKDMGDLTQFMNRPIHVNTFAGTAQLPAGLSEPLFLPTRHQLQLTTNKIAGGAVNVRLFFGGAIFYSWSTELAQRPKDRAEMEKLIAKYLERRKYIYPFYLTAESDNGVLLPANGRVEIDALIGDDGHFEATHWVSEETNEGWEVEIFNPDTKQALSNSPISKRAMIGTAQNPQELPMTYLVPAGSRLRFKFRNLAAVENRVFFTMRGLKIRAPMRNIDLVKKDIAVPNSPVQNFVRRASPVGV
jgi:hypothetical protein